MITQHVGRPLGEGKLPISVTTVDELRQFKGQWVDLIGTTVTTTEVVPARETLLEKGFDLFGQALGIIGSIKEALWRTK